MSAASSSRWYLVISKVGGLILMTAGILKIAAPSAGLATALPEPFFTGIPVAEILLGTWLLVGCYPHYARWAALVAFSGLFGPALLLGHQGELSCNCFGAFSVNPWWMVTLDGSLVAVLVAVPVEPTPQSGLSRTLAASVLTIIGASAGVYGGKIIVTQVPPDDVVIITPTSWHKSAQHIFYDADIGNDLLRGEWVIMLHRADCSHCRDVMESYRQLQFETALVEQSVRFAMVEMNPQESPHLSKSIDRSRMLIGNLRSRRRWVVQTPIFLHSVDGRVIGVHEQLGSLEATLGSCSQISRVNY